MTSPTDTTCTSQVYMLHNNSSFHDHLLGAWSTALPKPIHFYLSLVTKIIQFLFFLLSFITNHVLSQRYVAVFETNRAEAILTVGFQKVVVYIRAVDVREVLSSLNKSFQRFNLSLFRITFAGNLYSVAPWVQTWGLKKYLLLFAVSFCY